MHACLLFTWQMAAQQWVTSGLSATPSSCMSRLLPMQTRTSTELSLLLVSLAVSPAVPASDTAPSCRTASALAVPLPPPAAPTGPGAPSNCGGGNEVTSGSRPARWEGGTVSQHLRPRPEMASEATAGASQATSRSWCACKLCRECHAEGCPPCSAQGNEPGSSAYAPQCSWDAGRLLQLLCW